MWPALVTKDGGLHSCWQLAESVYQFYSEITLTELLWPITLFLISSFSVVLSRLMRIHNAFMVIPPFTWNSVNNAPQQRVSRLSILIWCIRIYAYESLCCLLACLPVHTWCRDSNINRDLKIIQTSEPTILLHISSIFASVIEIFAINSGPNP